MMIVKITAVMLLLGGVTAVDRDSPPDKLGPDPVYNDTCGYYYSDLNVRCGDKCIYRNADCHCGSDIFQPSVTEEHCCITSDESCTREPGERYEDGVCSKGRKMSMSSHCNNSDRSLQCFSSYQDSQILSYRSHYTCPHTCVSVLDDMCRGVNWCGSDAVSYTHLTLPTSDLV